jgi:hypothetical protein
VPAHPVADVIVVPLRQVGWGVVDAAEQREDACRECLVSGCPTSGQRVRNLRKFLVLG